MKLFHLLAFFVMLFFAALQWNDVDAARWVTIYLCTALLALITFKTVCIPCTAAWTVLIILFAIFLFTNIATGLNEYITNGVYSEIFERMNEQKPYIEQAREAIGLFIILIYCAITLIHLHLKHKQNSS